MKLYFPLLLCILMLTELPATAAQKEHADAATEKHLHHGSAFDCANPSAKCNGDNVTCSPDMRGRCGKRRGDWYGARQPVATAEAAQTLLKNYFAEQGYSISEVSEKKWGFRATIFDSNGKTIDRVMIDKRSGRIRSIN